MNQDAAVSKLCAHAQAQKRRDGVRTLTSRDENRCFMMDFFKIDRQR